MPQQQTIDYNKLQSIVDLMRSANNPSSALQYIISQNPQLQQAAELVKQNNGDFQQTYLKLARERNVDPNQFLNFLKRNNLK